MRLPPAGGDYRDKERDVKEDDHVLVAKELRNPALIVVGVIDARKLHRAVERKAEQGHGDKRHDNAGDAEADVVLVELSTACDAGTEVRAHPHGCYAYEHRQALLLVFSIFDPLSFSFSASPLRKPAARLARTSLHLFCRQDTNTVNFYSEKVKQKNFIMHRFNLSFLWTIRRF